MSYRKLASSDNNTEEHMPIHVKDVVHMTYEAQNRSQCYMRRRDDCKNANMILRMLLRLKTRKSIPKGR